MEATGRAAEILVGKTVMHSAFGSGVIEELKGNVVKVKFSEGEKKFIYPDAFKSFLRIDDKASRDALQRKMEQQRERLQERREELEEKDEKRRRLLSIRIIPNSHAVFNVKDEELEDCTEKCCAYTGKYASGFSEGLARRAGRVKPNSLIILSCLKKGAEESERELKGVFMAAQDFYGDDCGDGIIRGHELYRYFPKKGAALKIWDMVNEEDVPKRFGGQRFRYLSTASALKLLQGIKEIDSGRAQELESFISYFKKINKL